MLRWRRKAVEQEISWLIWNVGLETQHCMCTIKNSSCSKYLPSSSSSASSPFLCSTMGTEFDNQLHVLFFPLMVPGHMLPIIDMAKLFASRNVKATIITTTLNAPLLLKSIQKIPKTHAQISLKILKFPFKEAGLPEGLENLDSARDPETNQRFYDALPLFQRPLESVIEELRPHALVADIFLPWATDAAEKYSVPRICFHGTSFFSMCATHSLMKYKPHQNVHSDTELFVLPGLPDQIKLTRFQLFETIRLGVENYVTRLLKKANEMEKRSYGMLVNSFYELEHDYADHYRNVMAIKAWHIGPLSLPSKNIAETTSNEHQESLKWLQTKNPDSVIYLCFGTSARLTNAQLFEIAMGLEASEQHFIWVVRKENNGEEDKEDWLPQGYEERIKDRGLIIRGWAPQVLILNHKAVGGFVTHCGWNSVIEAVSAGLPMVTWPIFAEQFYNEKLITDVAKIGVGVGAQKWVRFVGDFVKREAIAKAVKEIMVGEKADELRLRAKAYGKKAKAAIQEGGSSYDNMTAFIQDLKKYHALSP